MPIVPGQGVGGVHQVLEHVGGVLREEHVSVADALHADALAAVRAQVTHACMHGPAGARAPSHTAVCAAAKRPNRQPCMDLSKH